MSDQFAADVIASSADNEKRLDEFARKIESVINEVGVASGLTFDEVLGALVIRQQAKQHRRAVVRVAIEREMLESRAAETDAEVERRLAAEELRG